MMGDKTVVKVGRDVGCTMWCMLPRVDRSHGPFVTTQPVAVGVVAGRVWPKMADRELYFPTRRRGWPYGNQLFPICPTAC